VRSFRLLTGGQFASTIGDYCYAVALPWFVLATHGGTILLGTVLACYGVPRTALIPVGGMLADRVGPRTLMLAADATRCGFVAVLALLSSAHPASVIWLGPLAALIGGGQGLFLPASYAIMPSLLGKELLAAGNAISSAAVQAGSLIGPALGGALVAAVGPAPAFGVDAASFAISALTLMMIPRRPASGFPAAAGAGRDTAGSVLALLRESRALQVIIIVTIVANLVGGGLSEVALPALAHEHFGASGFGALLACFAGGAVVGTLTAAWTGKGRRPVVLAGGAFLAEAVAMSVAPYLGGEAGASAALFLLGSCNGAGNVTVFTVVQKGVPPAQLGRVMGAIMLCAFGSFPLSVLVTGLLVQHLGPAVFFPVAGATIAIAVIGGLTQREFRELGAVAPGGASSGELIENDAGDACVSDSSAGTA
jgi:MFS family permease